MFAPSASVTSGFSGSDPGRGTTHHSSTTPRQHPTEHNKRHSQLEYTTRYWGLWGEEEERKNKEVNDRFSTIMVSSLTYELLRSVFKFPKSIGIKNYLLLFTSYLISLRSKNMVCMRMISLKFTETRIITQYDGHFRW